MRIRYKASVVVVCFVAFYVGIIPIYAACVEPADACTLVRNLITSTRLAIPAYDVIPEYAGTVWEVEESNIGDLIS
ncbi:MAG: hypothetical protein J4F28_03290 [Nitrosopumilaceae archaeon]|nr:hypothetical protein [Nitrosopumilaceae archaeon]